MVDRDTSLFESARSEWDLQVTSHEMRRVMQTVSSMAHHVPDPVVWVQKMGPATRRWFSNTFKLNMFFDTAGTDSDPVTPVAVPFSFLSAVYHLTETYGTATIFLNTAENVLTASSGGEYVFVDETVEIHATTPFDPRLLDRVSSANRFEKVAIRSDVLKRIVTQYRDMQHSVGELDGPPAFIAIKTERDTIRWTSDWSRWGHARLSGFSVASTWINHFEISFYPLSLFRFLNGIMLEEELTIGTADSWVCEGDQFFAVMGTDWAAWCPVENESWERWGGQVDVAFEEFGFENDGEDMLTSDWSENPTRRYVNEDVTVMASIIDGSAGPDCIRLHYAVDHRSILTFEVLEEVMLLNGTLVNARLTVDSHYLTLIVDVDGDIDHAQIVNGIRSMLDAIGRVSGLEQLLPLFGGVRPKESWEIDDEDADDEDPEDDDSSD